MPTRPDLRDITTGVKDALSDCDRDQLLDILTFVMKEYVVDGPPPMLMHQTESIADLSTLSFAQLVTALQTRLDVGLLLPCNVVVYEDDEQRAVVMAIDPMQTMAAAGDPGLAEIAAEVGAKLARVLESLP